MSHLGESLPVCGPGSSHALPLSHSPLENLLYLLKRKTLPSPFSAGKRPLLNKRLTPWTARGFFVPKINKIGGN